MLQLLTSGLRLVWAPLSGWKGVHRAPRNAVNLIGYMALLSVIPIASRLIGHVLREFPLSGAIADALLFIIIVIACASGSGVLLAAAARRMGRKLTDKNAQTIALLSITPLFVVSPLFALPVAIIQPYITLLALGWGAVLVLNGLWTFTDLDTRGATIVGLTGASVWILSSTILTQVLLLVLSPR